MHYPIPYTLATSAEILTRRDHCVIIDRKKLKCSVIHTSEAFILSFLDTKITRSELAGIFSGIYDVRPEDALITINSTIERLKTYLSSKAGLEMDVFRYQPETFIYPGFSELPGMTTPMDSPLYLTLVLGNRCNFKCIYCYANLSGPPLSLSSSAAIGLINDAEEMGAVSVCLSGGEPLLHPDIDKIVFAATERGMLVVLATNAALLNEPMADRLRRAGLESIQVSLDTPSASLHHFITGSENSFDRVIAGIGILKARGLRVGVRSVIMPHNWKEVPELVDLLSGLNVDEISLTTQANCSCNFEGNTKMARTGKMESDFLRNMIIEKSVKYPGCELFFTDRELKWQSHKDIVPCGSPMSTLVVHPSGEVTICEMIGDDPEISIGNIHRSDIRDMWLGQRHQHFLKEITNASRVDPDCARCGSLGQCRTGCFSFSKGVHGDYYKKDPRCPGPDALEDNRSGGSEHA